MVDIKEGFASMVSKYFDKKSKNSGVTLANKSGIKSTPQNEQLADELHKPIIKKFKKRKVYSEFNDNIWAADLADMQLMKSNRKPNKIWVDKGGEFCNRSMKSWLQKMKYRNVFNT